MMIDSHKKKEKMMIDSKRKKRRALKKKIGRNTYLNKKRRWIRGRKR